MSPKIIVALNPVNYKDGRKRQHQEAAFDILERNKPSNVDIACFNYPTDDVNVPPTFKVFKCLERNSAKTIRNTRPLPYISDIFNHCSHMEADVIGYINSDVLLSKEFFSLFSKDIDAYMFSRTDITPVNHSKLEKKDFRVVWNEHPGYDGFFFRRAWWSKNRKKFSAGLILGEPEWDYYYRKRIVALTDKRMNKRALYHVFHNTIWTLESPGAIHNRTINGAA